ncbi:GNAT family N-acetyltransferase [Brevibacillus fulvus]|uniref:Ribosomal protein S18 acetylase RimI-like enzyme n=1 Tax=Brevibacillus fulvus TaxID=1125967 RepID=A0A939BNJ0_9BACL|nr:N-acetyltransferase [Brevibacillus fulvus]MBM7589125.1 ribosomal protein S18 acetylase RimI-like enzyme [Brevibacillus fulvus]
MVKIRNVKIDDLPQLAAIEQLCFSKEEAATKEAFEQRIQLIPDSFFVAEVDGAIVGFINGPVIETAYITDDLFTTIKMNPATGGHQSILGLAVHPQFQKNGIASELLMHLEKEARWKKRETITLTCKENLIGYYEKHGYISHGMSNSEHAGEKWYNMIKIIRC